MKRISFVILLSLILLISACSNEEEPAPATDAVDNVVEEEISEDVNEKDTENADPVLDRLSATYVDMMKNESYTMRYKTTMNFEGEEVESNVSMSLSEGRMAFETIMEDVHSATVMQDEKAYFIDHSSQTVMVMPFAQDDIIEDGPQVHNIEADTLEYVGSGNKEFFGESMSYEEYASGDGTIFYYFDDGELVGMEMIFGDGTVTMIIEEFTDQVDESIFEIPEDYQVMEIGN